MKYIDLPVPDYGGWAAAPGLFSGAVNRAIEEGVGVIRFRPFTPASVVLLAKTIRDMKRRHAVTLEVMDEGLLRAHPRLRQALALAGADAIRSVDPPEKQSPEERSADAFIEHPSLLPHDYLVLNDSIRDGGRSVVREAILRLTYACNERCHFCWILPDQPDVPLALTSAVIRRLVRRGITYLSFSGGEPTLQPALPDLIREAKDAGMTWVILQTNGVLLARRERAEHLVQSGLDSVFLALHAHEASLSESITGLKGAHEKTVAALRNFLSLPVYTMVDMVINRLNAGILPDFARFAVKEAERAGKSFEINFAIAQPMGRYAPLFAEYTPRLSSLRGPLAEALDILKAGGVAFTGFLSECGAPLCALKGRPDLLSDLPEHIDKRASEDFVKAPACARCRMTGKCHGIRRLYADAFSTDEAEPFP